MLKRQVLKASVWSLVGSSGQQIIGFLVFLYLVRALSPAEIGLVALAAILVEIVASLTRLGTVDALQRQEPDAAAENAVLTMMLVSGSAGLLLLLAAAGVVAAVGGGSQLALLMLLLAPIALLQAVSGPPEAILRRRLDFVRLAIRSWSATLAGGLIAVLMIANGYGLFALVGQRLGQAVVACLLFWLQLDARPRPTRNLAPGLPVLRTGLHVLVANVSGLLNARIADAISGTFLGPAALGFMRLGWRCMDVLVQIALTPVIGLSLAAFARLKHDAPALSRAYLRFTQFVAVGSLPLFFGLAAVADLAIRIFVGEQWLGALVVFQFLGFIIATVCVNYLFGPVMVAMNRSDIVMKQSVAQLVLGLPLLWLGATQGLAGVMIAETARNFGLSLYNIWAMERYIGVSAVAVVRMIAPPLVSSLLMWAAVAVFRSQVLFSGPWLELGASVALGAGVYMLALIAGDLLRLWPNYVRGGLRTIREAMHAPG